MEKHHFWQLAGKIAGTTVLIWLAVLLIGYVLGWSQPTQYSNGFFISGAILIVLGLFSVWGGFAQRANFDILYAEPAGQANIAERNQRTAADVIERYEALIFLVAIGLLLILVAIAIGRFLIPM